LIKRFFKRIGKGIKKAFKKIGKFFGKMGIIGQIGLMMFLPGIGGALMKGLGNVAGKLIAGNAGILKGVGHVLKGAHSFVQGGINAFRTVTEGVTSFVSQFTKTAASKLGFNVTDAAPDFFGKGGAWERVQGGIVENAKSILDPFRSNITITQGMQDSLIDNQTNLDIVSRNTGISKDMLTRLNPDSAFKVGDVINVDVGTLQPIPNGEIVDGLSNVSAKTQKELDLFNKQIEANKDKLGVQQIQEVEQYGFDEALKMPVDADGNPIPGFSKDMGFTSESFKPDPNKLGMPLNPDGSPVAGFDKNMGFDKSFEVKPRSIIANKPVKAPLADAYTMSGDITQLAVPKKEVVDAYTMSGDITQLAVPKEKKGLVGGFIDDFQEKPLRTASGAVTAAQSLMPGEAYPDSRGFTGVVQAEQAAPVGSYADENYFGPGLNTYSWADQMHLSMGTPSLFNNDNEWNNWLNTSFAGQNR
jgi:hypothetical protein